MPQVTDRATWQARIDELRVKEIATPAPVMHWLRSDAASRCGTGRRGAVRGLHVLHDHINELSYLNSRDSHAADLKAHL